MSNPLITGRWAGVGWDELIGGGFGWMLWLGLGLLACTCHRKLKFT